jgi:Tfp pilus assembly pilus retraction ATPase PilT
MNGLYDNSINNQMAATSVRIYSLSNGCQASAQNYYNNKLQFRKALLLKLLNRIHGTLQSLQVATCIHNLLDISSELIIFTQELGNGKRTSPTT